MTFSKAFDKVDHQRLLLKLHRLALDINMDQVIPYRQNSACFLDGETADACPVQ